MNWREGEIAGCKVLSIERYSDDRGWLLECFRLDELDDAFHPAMGYLSKTNARITRGPHEHVDQTDYFVFFDGDVTLFLWDDRQDSETYGVRSSHRVGSDNPCVAIVPPGVVHAYRNEGDEGVLILNLPNRLYAGPGRSEPVDEIRHEERASSRFLTD